MRTTRGSYETMSTAYQVLGSAERRYSGVEASIGKLKAEIAKADEEHMERMMFTMQLAGLTENVLRPNIERQKLLSKGAERIGVELPKRNIFKKLLTPLSGPNLSKKYGESQIPGSYLVELERIYQDTPIIGKEYEEYLKTSW